VSLCPGTRRGYGLNSSKKIINKRKKKKNLRREARLAAQYEKKNRHVERLTFWAGDFTPDKSL